MSNNKQSMKLYTEIQVIEAIDKASLPNMTILDILEDLTPIELPSDSLCINCDESESTHNICMNCIIKIGKENIQLPSDEEIDKMWPLYYTEFGNGLNEGAKQMRDKIQGGNNEQQ